MILLFPLAEILWSLTLLLCISGGISLLITLYLRVIMVTLTMSAFRDYFLITLGKSIMYGYDYKGNVSAHLRDGGPASGSRPCAVSLVL